MKIKLLMVREGPVLDVLASTPREVFDFLRDKASGLDREYFWRIDLAVNNKILDYEVLSIGTLSSSLVHPRETFKGAILSGAAGIIVAHNHPSQEVQPSKEDHEVTNRLKKAGDILGIPLVDHIIVSDTDFFSFRRSGLIGLR